MSFGKAGSKDVADAGAVIKYDPDSLFSVPVDSGADSWQALTVAEQLFAATDTSAAVLNTIDTLCVLAQNIANCVAACSVAASIWLLSISSCLSPQFRHSSLSMALTRVMLSSTASQLDTKPHLASAAAASPAALPCTHRAQVPGDEALVLLKATLSRLPPQLAGLLCRLRVHLCPSSVAASHP